MWFLAQLRAGRNFVRQVVSKRFETGAAIHESRGVVKELENLNRGTEADFLAVGGKLMAFLTGSRQLHSDIQQLTALVSGDQAQDACRVLVSVRGYVDQMRRHSEESARALAILRGAAGRIHTRFSTFGKIAMSFHITAILARIETAHLSRSNADLGNLADDVRSCSDAIVLRAARVLEAAQALDVRIGSTLAEVARLDGIQQNELPALLAAVNSDLEMFSSRQQVVAGASTGLTADLESVSQELGGIATSLQFHDITRQQVEHVIEALTDLAGDSQRGKRSSSPPAVMRLQSAQLKSAAAAFIQSTEKIDRDLDGIAARVDAMAGASKRILGLDQNGQDSFLTDMQQRFAVILQTLRESRSIERTTRAILGELDDLSQRLRRSVADVQAIELQLSRISVNAAVSASHIGTAGEPLNVVAGAVQALQLECASRSREAEADLDAIGGTILTFSAEPPEEATLTGDATDAALFDELRGRMSDLQSANSSSLAAANTVAMLAGELCRNLQEARQHSGIGQRFGETVDSCCGVLDRLTSQLQARGASEPDALQEAFEERYTMHVERHVHQAVAGGAADPAFEAPPQAAEEEVEFF